MVDDPEKKIPKAIKNHKPEPTYEMNSPGGRALQKASAEKQSNQDHKDYQRNRAAKYAKIDKAKIASKEQVREGERGNLGKEFDKERSR